jgi:hypothetical protein
MWYLYTMEFYAAMKKNEMLSFAGKWMELENIILIILFKYSLLKQIGILRKTI